MDKKKQKPAQPVIKLRQLFCTEGRQNLHDVTLDLIPKRAYLTLGRADSGTTLLLHVINGLIKVPLHTRQWHEDFSPAHQSLATQSPSFLPRSAWDNLKFFAKKDALSMERAIAILQRLDLLDIAHAPVITLSPSHRRLLHIVRALMFNPTLLLLDSPFSDLTETHSKKLASLLEEYREDNVLVYTAADIPPTPYLADHIIFMHEGHIAEVTAPRVFWQMPKSLSARAFLRESRMLNDG